MKQFKTLNLITFLFAIAAFAFAVMPSSAHADGGLTISGAQQGDYTYESGVLTITKPGNYVIGMAQPGTTTTDRIVLSYPQTQANSHTTLTFNELNIDSGEKPALDCNFSDYPFWEKSYSVKIIVNGSNRLVADNYVVYSLYNNSNLALEGSGTLDVISENPKQTAIDVNSMSVGVASAGKLTVKGGVYVRSSFQVNSGSVDIDSGSPAGILVEGQYLQTGGTVSVKNTDYYGIKVSGHFDPDITNGVVVSGGSLEVNAKQIGIQAGDHVNEQGIVKYYRKNIVVTTPKTVKITAPYGIFSNEGGGTWTMDKGEMEIISSVAAICTFPLTYGEDYAHANYVKIDGAIAKIADSSMIMLSQDTYAQHYALITPVYPIEYKLDGGSMPSGKDNRTSYSRIDEFVLNNPEKEGATFLGWTGTGLSGPTKTVTVPAGSKGAREYTAIWSGQTEATIVYQAGQGGSVSPQSEVIPIGGEAKGTTATPAAGYKFKNWTDTNGNIVSTDPHFVPQKTGSAYTNAAYTANFEKEPEPTPVPKSPSGILLARVKASGTKALKLDWTKVQNVDGYDIYMAKCGNTEKYKRVKTVNGNMTYIWTKTGLKKETAYKLCVKAWVMKNGKKNYVRTSQTIHAFTSGGNKKFTNAKSVTYKKSSISLKKGKTRKIKPTVKKLKKNKKLMSKKHAARLRYLSSDKKVATVTKKGKIKGVGKGKCTIYAYAHNGVRKAIKVTVK